MQPQQLADQQVEQLKLQDSCLYFILVMWGLIPQPVKPEYKARFAVGLLMKGKNWDKFCKSVTPEWFEEYKDGHHITWQQSLVLYGIDKSLRGEVPARISIVSGHGIGKSTMLSWIILWFLFVHPQSQVPCTAPTASTLFDVLWKEIAKWIEKMPDGVKAEYEWQGTHIRMRRSPETWFARAKTASKESPEALAGVHADWVLIAVDEASGVEEPIFETMEGALTSGNILVIIISNGTRSIGYFYDSHHKDEARWQNYGFSSLESPRVDQKYVDSIISKYGSDSVQYEIRVKGGFPDEGIMDEGGYVQLFNEKDLRFTPFDKNWKPVGRTIGALDPSGEGQDLAATAARDRMIATILHTEKTTNTKQMAAKSITLCDRYLIDPIDFVVDSFGVGADVGMEMALMTSQAKRPWRITPVNVGEACEDEYERQFYVNKRAEMYYKMMLWARAGGTFMELPTAEETNRLRDELLSIRFKRTMTGRIQMMDKVAMKKLGFKSPNMADAVAMTFLRPDGARRSIWGDPVPENQQSTKDFDAAMTME